MACNDKIRNTCGEPIYSTCVDYEGVLNDYTSIMDSCVTIHETTEDLYNLTGSLYDNLKTDSLGNKGISYTLTEGSILPKDVFISYENEISNLKTDFANLNDLKNLDISGWGIDFQCLADSCSNSPITLGQFADTITRAICEGVLPPVFETNPRITSGAISGNNLILTRDDASTINIDATSLLDNTNLSRITSGAVVGNDMIFTRGDSTQFGVNIATLINTPNNSSVIGGTVIGNDLILTKSDSSNIQIDISSFLDDTNLARVEGMTLSGNTLTLTRGDSTSVTADLSSLLDNTNLSRIVSGTVSGNNLTLTRNDGSSFVIDVTGLAGAGADGNDFITGGTLSGTTLNLTGTGGAGASINLSSLSNTDSQTLGISGQTLSISGGNSVTLPQPTGFNRYVGRVTQSGTNNPVPIVFEDTLGGFTWSRITTGQYTLTPNIPSNYDASRVVFNFTQQNGPGTSVFTVRVAYDPTNIQLLTYNNETQTDFLMNGSFELTQY